MESQVIEESDIGSAEEVLDLSQTAKAPESVPEVKVEKVADFETGKTPDELKPKFMSTYMLMSEQVDAYK